MEATVLVLLFISVLASGIIIGMIMFRQLDEKQGARKCIVTMLNKLRARPWPTHNGLYCSSPLVIEVAVHDAVREIIEETEKDLRLL